MEEEEDEAASRVPILLWLVIVDDVKDNAAVEALSWEEGVAFSLSPLSVSTIVDWGWLCEAGLSEARTGAVEDKKVEDGSDDDDDLEDSNMLSTSACEVGLVDRNGMPEPRSETTMR